MNQVRFSVMKALKWIGITLGSVATLFVVAGLVLYWSVKPYLASDSFRSLVESEVSKILQIEVKLEPLKWNGLSVFTNSIQTVGSSKVAIKSIDIQQLRVSIALRPLLQRIARIDQIELQSLAIEFQVPEPQTQQATSNNEPLSPPPAWIQSLAPNKIEIGEIAVQRGKLRWPSGENSFGQLAQFRVNASMDGNDFNLTLGDGLLEIPQIPPLKLQTLKGRAHQKQLFITIATLQYENQGSFTLDGDLGFDLPNTAHLNFEINTVPIAPFLSGDWRARLIGNINGKLKLTQDENTKGIPEVHGSVELVQGKIEALPLFNKIAEITQTEQWKNILLDRAKANLHWTPQMISLDQIDFESKKLLLLQGNLQIEEENIFGKTVIGTDPNLLKSIPGLLDQVFNQAVGDYASTPMILSGTKENPKEDLTERLAIAAVSGLLQKLPGGLGDKVQSITDEIQKKAPGLLDLFKK